MDGQEPNECPRCKSSRGYCPPAQRIPGASQGIELTSNLVSRDVSVAARLQDPKILVTAPVWAESSTASMRTIARGGVSKRCSVIATHLAEGVARSSGPVVTSRAVPPLEHRPPDTSCGSKSKFGPPMQVLAYRSGQSGETQQVLRWCCQFERAWPKCDDPMPNCYVSKRRLSVSRSREISGRLVEPEKRCGSDSLDSF